MSGDWITFPGSPRRASARIVQEIQHARNAFSVQLDVHLELEQGRRIIEAFAGIGESRQTAIFDAFRNFVTNTFPVLLGAFFVEDDEEITVEEWEIDGRPRRVFIGNLGTRGQVAVGGPELVAWFPSFASRVKEAPLSSGTHWVRVYFAQMDHRLSELEVLLDNDDWHRLRDSLADIEWPMVKGFLSVRVFMVISDL